MEKGHSSVVVRRNHILSVWAVESRLGKKASRRRGRELAAKPWRMGRTQQLRSSVEMSLHPLLLI